MRKWSLPCRVKANEAEWKIANISQNESMLNEKTTSMLKVKTWDRVSEPMSNICTTEKYNCSPVKPNKTAWNEKQVHMVAIGSHPKQKTINSNEWSGEKQEQCTTKRLNPSNKCTINEYRSRKQNGNKSYPTIRFEEWKNGTQCKHWWW